MIFQSSQPLELLLIYTKRPWAMDGVLMLSAVLPVTITQWKNTTGTQNGTAILCTSGTFPLCNSYRNTPVDSARFSVWRELFRGLFPWRCCLMPVFERWLGMLMALPACMCSLSSVHDWLELIMASGCIILPNPLRVLWQCLICTWSLQWSSW